jgi:uncharacterized protein (DUF488 family)
MAAPHPLFTIGYEGRTVDELLDTLARAGVRLLIDVRAIAASRRPGFSKTMLAATLAERDISYLHLRALGTPKPGREAARKGRIAEMHAIYEMQLATPEAALAMEQAQQAAGERPAALLCFERDVACCHRAVIAQRLVAKAGFEVRDL